MDLREDTLCSESMITKGISAVTGSTEGQKGCHLSALSTLSSTLFTDQNTGLYESPFTDSPRSSTASALPSPRRARRTIPLPDTVEKKLYALGTFQETFAW